jgi:hypothetical protein
MKIAFSVLLIALGLHAAASANGNLRMLADSSVLLDSDKPDQKFAACQPLKGEQVQVLETKSSFGGIAGAHVARVLVIEGQCKGTEGWVGLAKLEKAADRR